MILRVQGMKNQGIEKTPKRQIPPTILRLQKRQMAKPPNRQLYLGFKNAKWPNRQTAKRFFKMTERVSILAIPFETCLGALNRSCRIFIADMGHAYPIFLIVGVLAFWLFGVFGIPAFPVAFLGSYSPRLPDIFPQT